VFVALDEKGKPRPVPPVVAETPSQLRRQREAKIRRRTRLVHKEAIAEHRRDDQRR
jgi:acyl-CoA hydrolase